MNIFPWVRKKPIKEYIYDGHDAISLSAEIRPYASSLLDYVLHNRYRDEKQTLLFVYNCLGER